MRALEKYFADEFFRWIIWAILIVTGLFIVYGTSIYFYGKNQRRCTDTELNLVIDKVNECKKTEVICTEKTKNKILHEICGAW